MNKKASFALIAAITLTSCDSYFEQMRAEQAEREAESQRTAKLIGQYCEANGFPQGTAENMQCGLNII